MSEESEVPPLGGQFLVYQTEDGKLKIDVRFEGETVWLTQQDMAELFQTTKQNVGQHLKSIFAEGELVQDSVVKESFTTAADGKNYATRFYNLDAIISVGYRVKSAVASQPVDVYLVIRQTDEMSGQQVIRWMNVTRYLKARKDKKSRQIIFDGEKLDMEAVWKVRDGFFPPR